MKNKIVQEIKPIKRIGYITTYNHRIIAKIKDWQELFDVKKYLPSERFKILEKIPGAIAHQEIFENLTPTVGFAAITKGLTGNLGSVDELEVTAHALGTGTTAPSSSDTKLVTEGARIIVSSKTYSGNKAYYTVFYGLSEGVGSWTEMGLFIDGDPLITDDGILWDRSLVTITKTNAQSLTIDYEDTFSNA